MGKHLKQQLRHSARLIQDLSILSIDDSLITVQYPYNVDFCEDFLRQQDEFVQSCYHHEHAKLPQLLILLDGISELADDVKPYIQSAAHQQLYSSVAYTLSHGNMAVLEQHYLENSLTNYLQNNPKSLNNFYPIGIFSSQKLALDWLSTRPGSHHQR